MINVVLFSLLTLDFNHRVVSIEYSVYRDKGMEIVKCIPNVKGCTKQTHQYTSKIIYHLLPDMKSCAARKEKAHDNHTSLTIIL